MAQVSQLDYWGMGKGDCGRENTSTAINRNNTKGIEGRYRAQSCRGIKILVLSLVPYG